jgi:hypothetical protein
VVLPIDESGAGAGAGTGDELSRMNVNRVEMNTQRFPFPSLSDYKNFVL